MSFLVCEDMKMLKAIVGFLPVVEATRDSDRPLTDHLKALTALCRAFPLLGARIGSQNRGFWQLLMLSNFDFTASYSNADSFEMTAGHAHITYKLNQSSTTSTPVGFPPREDWPRILDEMTKHESSHGGSRNCMLAEYLVWWPSIGAHFRSSEYAFLHRIQVGELTIDDWPDHEDPFTLYCDLVLLKEHVAKVDKLETHGSWGFSPVPILMGRMQKEIMGSPYTMLHHCHISPFFWTGLPPVSEKWSGLDSPLPAEEERSRTQEEDEIFPLTPQDPDALRSLQRLVHESFDDWRRVHVNFDETGGYQESPEFYIGKSKKSGRWLGFVGESVAYRRDSGEPKPTAMGTGAKIHPR